MLQSDRTHQAILAQTCCFFALSVICSDADLPVCCSFRHGLRRATFLREEGFGFTRSLTCLSLWERCRAATERAGSLVRELDLPQEKTEGVCQTGKIRMRFALRCTCPHVCPLSHLLRKCQLSQRESQEAGASCTHAASGYLLRRPARVLLLPSRLAPRHLPQGERLWFRTIQLVSPSGRDVAQRQRGHFS